MTDKSVKKPRSIHPNSLANLQGPRWKPGEPGNPQGTSLSFDMKMILDKGTEYLDKMPDSPRKEILTAWITHSLYGKEGYFREMLDRTEGKVKLPIEGDINLNITGDMLALAFRVAEGEKEPV